jgi:hypothetical protein
VSLKKNRPIKSQPGALDTLLAAIPAESVAIAALEGAAAAKALGHARDAAWEQLKERDYETWNGQLVLAIWRLQGRIPSNQGVVITTC